MENSHFDRTLNSNIEVKKFIDIRKKQMIIIKQGTQQLITNHELDNCLVKINDEFPNYFRNMEF